MVAEFSSRNVLNGWIERGRWVLKHPSHHQSTDWTICLLYVISLCILLASFIHFAVADIIALAAVFAVEQWWDCSNKLMVIIIDFLQRWSPD
jgi:hypothetical protein